MNPSHKALRGVNLGGWLLLEKWMTPTLFEGTDAIDEYTFMQTDDAHRKIERHRHSFIREADFKWLAANGIEAVRIPIGYWIFDGDEPFAAGITHLDWAVKMAAKYRLRVLLDLHGAKGSQNGKDHSGKLGRSEWFARHEYRQQTIDVLERLAKRYYHDDYVWGIEVLNEPKIGIFHFKLRRFYNRAYDALLKVARPGTYIVFHDAFTPRLLSGAVLASSSLPVAMDVHWYQFGRLLHRFETMKRYFKAVRKRDTLIGNLQRRQPLIIGEWSVVLSGAILNGASREEEQAFFKEHAQHQLAVYDGALAWFYWTYKTEGRGIWHFRSQVEDGIIVL